MAKDIPQDPESKLDHKKLSKEGDDIVKIVKDFNLDVEYDGAIIAPSVVRHKFRLLSKAKKMSEIIKLSDDIALKLGLEHAPRVCRHRNHILVEIPRAKREFPHINDAIARLPKNDKGLKILCGINTDNEIMLHDIPKSADCHGLGAGATNSGKTQGVYAIIAALVQMYPPSHVQLAIYDGKKGLILPEELKPWMFCKKHTPEEGSEFVNRIYAEKERRIELRDGYNNINDFAEDNPDERPPTLIVLMDEYSVDRDQFEQPMLDDSGEEIPKSNMMMHLLKVARSENINFFVFDQHCKDQHISNRVKENMGMRLIFRMNDVKSSDYLEVEDAHKLLGKGDLLVRAESIISRCQMPNCSEKDLKAIAKARLIELELAEPEQPKQVNNTEAFPDDWYFQLLQYGMEEERTPRELLGMWTQLSSKKPTPEDIQVLHEHLHSLRNNPDVEE